MEPLCVGIDVSKATITAGFLSASLLIRHKRFKSCPSQTFPQSREGFENLLSAMRVYAPDTTCLVLMERTGHYHLPLMQFLWEKGIACYWLHIQKRPEGMVKSDKRDALGLANTLYNQQVLGAQSDADAHIRAFVPSSAIALRLKGLVHRRDELVNDITRRKNKLTAICDQLFPELATIIGNVNNQTALALRVTYPTAAALATAPVEALIALRVGKRPGNANMARLHDLAAASIGLRDEGVQAGLILEQGHLIAELRLLQRHLEVLEAEITTIITTSREGKILMSIPPIGVMQAAVLFAGIGSIANFEGESALKSYCGWAPRHRQTGTTLDTMRQTPGGNVQLKKMVYFITIQAVARDTEWRTLYQRLVPLKCRYDARTGTYRGKMKVLGRVAGQILRVIYVLLKQDYDTLALLADGDPIPDPVLYDRAIHQAHRQKTPLPVSHDSPC